MNIGGGNNNSLQGAITSSAQLNSNTWTHVAVTYSNSTVRFYVNGSLVDTSTKIYTMGSNNKAFSISTATQSFDGRLDDLRYYNRALSDTEISQVYGEQATGSSTYLADALGSIVALADSNKVIQTEYDYEPFGATTTTGAGNKNSYKFTGREDDGTGLYYYRARYYHPALGRFVSEDPFWMTDGPNMYAYVRNNPLTWTDPFGLAGIDEFVRKYLLNQVKIGAGLGIAEMGVQLAVCALLQPGQTTTIRSPVSQVLTVVLFPILADQGGYIIALEVTKNRCGATECTFRYIAIPIAADPRVA